MPHARYLMAAALLILLTVVPVVTNTAPTAVASAAQDANDHVAWAGAPGGLAADTRGVAQSNENERKDQQDRRGRNQNDSDDNDDGEDWDAPPPAPQVYVEESPPRAAATESRRCLNAGESVTLDAPNGTVTVKVFQDGVKVEVVRVAPSSVPPPDGGLLGDLVFRVAAGPCNDDWWSAFPNEVNVGVRYGDSLAAGHNESAFTLALYDGSAWVPVAKGAADPPNNYVSASVATAGTYGLMQH